MIVPLRLVANAFDDDSSPPTPSRAEPVGVNRRATTARDAPADLVSAALVATLDHLGAPAFVVDEHGAPAYANAVGAAVLERDRRGTTERVRKKIRAGFPDVRPIRAPGLRPHWLVVLAPDTMTRKDRLAAATHRWALTERQAEVLRLVVKGDTNKVIAATLGCAEVTVESHVTALFRKASADSRAQLVSSFWTL